MGLPYVQCNVFAQSRYSGAPVGVCVQRCWGSEQVLQRIARVNALPESVFVDGEDGDYRLQAFSADRALKHPVAGAMAAAHVVLSDVEPEREEISFAIGEQRILVRREGMGVSLETSAIEPIEVGCPMELVEGVGRQPEVVLDAGMNLIAVFSSERCLRSVHLRPDRLRTLRYERIIATAPGDDDDFVYRSVHADDRPGNAMGRASELMYLIPYWTQRFGVERISAREDAVRGCAIRCRRVPNRIRIRGRVVEHLRGELNLSPKQTQGQTRPRVVVGGLTADAPRRASDGDLAA
ncbi:MAG: PhzF family phenazine biosynthesis protein [Bdellovibrionales bacterium]|nr:PhzF family phenazine biosynthesis protein [Bdellovibrionales bacterium]